MRTSPIPATDHETVTLRLRYIPRSGNVAVFDDDDNFLIIGSLDHHTGRAWCAGLHEHHKLDAVYETVERAMIALYIHYTHEHGDES